MRSALQVVLFVCLASAVLLPPFELKPGWPKVELSDLLLPLVAVLLFGLYQTNPRMAFRSANISLRVSGLIFSSFIALTVVSIVVNGRLAEIRDWFEVAKYLKFGLFTLAFLVVASTDHFRRVAFVVLVPVLVFNILHYFNILGFNELVEPWYAPHHHLDVFGLNSLGEPATKRSLGTMGNPNVNATLFLLFLLLFMRRSNRVEFPPLYTVAALLSIVGVFMCQSRTALITFCVLMLLYMIFAPRRYRMFMYYSLFALVVFLVLHFAGNAYLTTVVDPDRLQHTAAGRMEQWSAILDAMPGKWLLGNAPSKEYFEQREIFSESEYFLILFRYGILGTALFFGFWLHLIYRGLRASGTLKFSLTALPLLLLLTATTNNPMHAPKLVVMIAFALAFVLSLSHEPEHQT